MYPPAVFTRLYTLVQRDRRPDVLRALDVVAAWLGEEDCEPGLLALGLERDGKGWCTRATVALPVDLDAGGR